MGAVQLGMDIWVMASALAGFIVAGIVRVELLAYRVRELERMNIILDKRVFALQTEINNVCDGLTSQLSEIKETLAWIKGRFSILEEAHAIGGTQARRDR